MPSVTLLYFFVSRVFQNCWLFIKGKKIWKRHTYGKRKTSDCIHFAKNTFFKCASELHYLKMRFHKYSQFWFLMKIRVYFFFSIFLYFFLFLFSSFVFTPPFSYYTNTMYIHDRVYAKLNSHLTLTLCFFILFWKWELSLSFFFFLVNIWVFGEKTNRLITFIIIF